MLNVEAATKSFGGFKALKKASLNVKQGKIIAVIGPNGAGKSTLFNIITGHLKPNGGRITFKGKDITGQPPFKICHQGIARSFQLINIFNRLTVFENVQVSVLSRKNLIGNVFKPSRRLVLEETREILEKVGLHENLYNTLCTSLSYGDQKILEIAIALGNTPELLLLDEPTAGMSAEDTRKTINLIKELAQKEGLTILFTEHDIDMVFNIADEIMVLHQGQTIIQAKPEDVRQNKEVQSAYLGEALSC